MCQGPLRLRLGGAWQFSFNHPRKGSTGQRPKDETMSNARIETITIDGTEYVRKDSIPAAATPVGSKRIVVADRGWVFVGNCEDHDDGSVTITNCCNIRRWGTTAGLGQLVNGPLPDTKYDAYGTVRCTPIVTIAVVKGW